ncbi:hypothetical protein [Streptacidiphilus albus]|uniref:hypothetical protein n=1 Tax=Streptacidiphilus albus TaxID=105425 RepID=UPI0009DCDCC8|nr:hypothetical protein [Streptacidiphilus albus]
MSVSIQISALAGVIVGSAASYVTSSLAERARWRRQQDVRWDERRLAAYADYISAVKDIIAIAQRMASQRGLSEDRATPVEPTAAELERLHEAEVRRAALIETVRLLTDTDTITATRELNHTVWHLAELARGQVPGDQQTWNTAFAEYRQARDAYHRCARATLGISGVAISRDQTWPPRWKPVAGEGPDGGSGLPPA